MVWRAVLVGGCWREGAVVESAIFVVIVETAEIIIRRLGLCSLCAVKKVSRG